METKAICDGIATFRSVSEYATPEVIALLEAKIAEGR